MRKARRGAVLALVSVMVLACGGCWVVSLHPLHTAETIVFDERLLGDWIEQKENNGDTAEASMTLTITRGEGKKYVVRQGFARGEGRTINFDAYLVQIGETRYLDLGLEDEEGNPFWKEMGMAPFFLMPAHGFFRLTVAGEGYTWTGMDNSALRKIDAKEEYATVVDSTPVLYIATARMQTLVREHGTALFENGSKFEWQRMRKPIPDKK
jgi:hypothetical protein